MSSVGHAFQNQTLFVDHTWLLNLSKIYIVSPNIVMESAETIRETEIQPNDDNFEETPLDIMTAPIESIEASLDAAAETVVDEMATTLQCVALQMKANIQETLHGLGKENISDTISDNLITEEKISNIVQILSETKDTSVTEASKVSENIEPSITQSSLDVSVLDDVEVSATTLDTTKLEFPGSEQIEKVPEGSIPVVSSDKKIKQTARGDSPSSPAISSGTSKRKSEKTADQVMKWLLSCSGSPEEKLQLLCRKHVETLDDIRDVETKLKHSERANSALSRDKEQLQAEHSRVLLIRSRLEGLCRELQRQNKVVKDESLLRLREEEEKRKEISTKFQSTLNDITGLTHENQQRNAKLKEENDELAKKLKGLIEHYEAWEKHSEKVNHQKELEVQLAKAKLTKSQLQLRQVQEEHLAERQRLIATLEALQERCTLLTANELQVRNELTLYTTKYEEFQTVLNNSNQVFGNFKSDMEKMSKKIKTLEKETSQWKTRWENSNVALIEMAADKQKRDQELISAHQRVTTLEKLCRALQAERNMLQNKLKSKDNSKDLSPPKDVPKENKENCIAPEVD